MHSLGIVIESFGEQQKIPFKVLDVNSHWVLESNNKKFPFKIFFQLINNNLLIRSVFTFETWRVDFNQLILYANYLNELSTMGTYLVQISDEEISDQRTFFAYILNLNLIDSKVLSANLPRIYSHFNITFTLAVAYLLEMINNNASLEDVLEGFQNKLKEYY